MRPLLCDWCRNEIEDEHSYVKVKFDNDNPQDCCQKCVKTLYPKPKIGRPKGRKNHTPPAEIIDPGATSEGK